MKELLETAGEIAEKMEEKGYKYFNIKYGGAGTDFKVGLATYLHNVGSSNTVPLFPIYAGSGIAATSPDNPYSWAMFKIVEDEKKGLRIDAMGISMYECHDGALRASLELKIKSLDDIPTRLNAAKMIEEKWKKQSKENQMKWNTSINVKPEMPKPEKRKGRKM